MSKYNVKELESLIKQMLSDHRYKHSLNVADLASKLAKAHGFDEEKAYVAGLLHDVTKEFDEDWQNDYLRKHNDLDKLNYPFKVKHSFTSKYYIKDELKIDDEDILDATYNHTICNSNKDICKILYIADKREVGRNLDNDVIELSLKDLDAGYKEAKRQVEEWLKEKENGR
ncbi:MAG: bis(5'-nucleosyl)-tetraphosphatase (symmetrical) YqeK [Erysipelotrichaceae bacterium]|nr:bis(5'-nucleosyl)-tetraphosphatase (symmetrical) YqeK [Erysipelotrichaceae bacterium]